MRKTLKVLDKPVLEASFLCIYLRMHSVHIFEFVSNAMGTDNK